MEAEYIKSIPMLYGLIKHILQRSIASRKGDVVDKLVLGEFCYECPFFEKATLLGDGECLIFRETVPCKYSKSADAWQHHRLPQCFTEIKSIDADLDKIQKNKDRYVAQIRQMLNLD